MNTNTLPLHAGVTPETTSSPATEIFQTTRFPLTGGCHCGAVRYTLRAAARSVVHCHCSVCRKVHGALSVAHALVERRDLTLDHGADDLVTYESSHRIHREFCRICGSSLFFEVENAADVTYIAAATLDGGAHPGHPAGSERHAYVGSKANWEHIDARLPRFVTIELETADNEDQAGPTAPGPVSTPIGDYRPLR